MNSVVLNGFRTWIEIDSKAIQNNIKIFKKIIGPKTKLWAVVKSNAYGHGLFDFSKAIDKFVEGFCVDSVIEGIKLRKIGIKKEILVLGPTLKENYSLAFKNDIAITISNFEALRNILKLKNKPKFHLKIDTGMHRQGFYLNDLDQIIPFLKNLQKEFQGVYTHFAMAQNLNFTENQFQNFKKAINFLKNSGFSNFISHCAATGGTLLNKKYHLDAVRIGIGLYGYFPSKYFQKKLSSKFNLKPVLLWKTIISEIKEIKKGEAVGYDLTWQAKNNTKIAILPIGYWHGYFRSLSNKGMVLIGKNKVKIIGRVCMDMIIINLNKIKAKIGDEVILIGQNKNNKILADFLGNLAGTTHYEFLTRINPLIYRIIK